MVGVERLGLERERESRRGKKIWREGDKIGYRDREHSGTQTETDASAHRALHSRAVVGAGRVKGLRRGSPPSGFPRETPPVPAGAGCRPSFPPLSTSN